MGGPHIFLLFFGELCPYFLDRPPAMMRIVPHIIVSKRGAKQMSIFDFNRDGEVSSSEQAFGLGAILAALSETEAR